MYSETAIIVHELASAWQRGRKFNGNSMYSIDVGKGVFGQLS